jgi:hypothetical protein
METPIPPVSPMSARLQRMSTELKDLELAMIGGDIDQRILLEFREAVNHVRHSAWAVQQWLDLKQKHQDPFEVLAMLVSERVRIGTQLCHELVLDAESQELTDATGGVVRLFHEVRDLDHHLKQLVHEA